MVYVEASLIIVVYQGRLEVGTSVLSFDVDSQQDDSQHHVNRHNVNFHHIEVRLWLRLRSKLNADGCPQTLG
jgi:hypothetical protein